MLKLARSVDNQIRVLKALNLNPLSIGATDIMKDLVFLSGNLYRFNLSSKWEYLLICF